MSRMSPEISGLLCSYIHKKGERIMNKFIHKVMGWVIVIAIVLVAFALIITFDIDWQMNSVLSCGLGLVVFGTKDTIKWFLKGGE